MIVKYNKKTGNENTDILLGRIYSVLSIDCQLKEKMVEVLISDEQSYGSTPFLEDIEKFEIMDSSLPDFWSIKKLDSGNLSIGPEEIQGEFWDRFYDNEPEALETMQNVIEKTVAFDQRKKACL